MKCKKPTKLIVLLFSCFLLTGCSLLPRITMDTPNTVPQSIDKSKAKEICKGKAVWSDAGVLLSCSKGYYNYDEIYGKKERRMTIVERVKSWFNWVFSFGFLGLGIICLLIPGAFTIVGAIIGRIFEGAYGIAKKSLDATVRAVQNARKNGKPLDDALSAEQDADVKKYIAKIKEEGKIK